MIVFAAGLIEVAFSATLKLSEGFTKGWWTAATIGTSLLNIWMMSLAVKTLPIGIAYAVWAGFGAAGTAVVGVVFYHEPVFASRVVFWLLIVVGIIGLQATQST